jgi:hypothetical protein
MIDTISALRGPDYQAPVGSGIFGIQMTYQIAATIAALRGPNYQVQDTSGIFGLPRFIVVRIVKKKVGKGRLPKRVLIKTLNTIYARRPRLNTQKQWHLIANNLFKNMSDGCLKMTSYGSMAKRIFEVVESNPKVINKPTKATILKWLKTNNRVDAQIVKFRSMRSKQF